MRYQLYRLFNRCVEYIPRPILFRILRALHLNPAIANRAGYQVFPETYYSPMPILSEIDWVKLKEKRYLPGVKLDTAVALQWLEKLLPFAGEVDQFFKNRTGDIVRWDETYQPCDAGTLYAMLRLLKPKRYIEVGCGWSTHSSVAAIRRNESEGASCRCTFVEPYPPDYFTELKLPGEFLHKKIQQVPLEMFQQLEAGDVLFIDTSHVLKVQNDVEHELLRVLPLIKPGVYVHIHDIFTPYDYPAEWVGGGIDEQYALEAMMSGGDDWEIILPVYLLWRDHADALKKLVYTSHRPAAFWLRKNARES